MLAYLAHWLWVDLFFRSSVVLWPAQSVASLLYSVCRLVALITTSDIACLGLLASLPRMTLARPGVATSHAAGIVVVVHGESARPPPDGSNASHRNQKERESSKDPRNCRHAGDKLNEQGSMGGWDWNVDGEHAHHARCLP